MKKDQLFRKYPSNELFLKVLNAFGLSGPDDFHSFSKNDLKVLKTIDKILEYKNELKDIYVPCKYKIYLTEITIDNVLNILRHMLKTRNISLDSKEKYIKCHKYIVYFIIHQKESEYSDQIIQNISSPNTLTFN